LSSFFVRSDSKEKVREMGQRPILCPSNPSWEARTKKLNAVVGQC
jgi:hypothetical protein